MLESSPKRLAASIARRKSIRGFHIGTSPITRPLLARIPGQSLVSRLIPKVVKTSLLVDQLGVSLALPVPVPLLGLSDIAVLTLSAVLRFRSDSTPLGFGLDTYRARARMLIEEKTANVASESGKAPLDGPSELPPPPAYSPTAQGSSSRGQVAYIGPQPDAEPLPPPANFVHVYRRDGEVRGRWNIDPGLSIPSAFLPSMDEDARKGRFPWEKSKSDKKKGEEEKEQEPMPNLKLHTRDGRIVADISVTESGAATSKPTLMDLYTRDGGINLRLRARGPSPLHLKLSTHDGPVRVFLPRTFVGLLTHKLRDGSLRISSEMQKHGGVTMFSSIEGAVGRSFVGEWKGFENQFIPKGDKSVDGAASPAAETWTGDQCEVTSRDGSAYFYWEDEYDAVMASLGPKAWLKSLFSPR